MKHTARAALAIVAALFLLAAASAFAQTANMAVITFAAPTARLDGTPIEGTLTYRLHQGLQGQPKTVVSTFTGTTATVTTGLFGGRTYCWQVSAFETIGSVAQPESALSNEACKTFQASPATAVTITVQ